MEEVGNEREWYVRRWREKEDWQWRGRCLLEEVGREGEWKIRRWMEKEGW